LVSFKSGEIDFMLQPPPDEMGSLVASGECRLVPQLGVYYYDYNCKVPPFDNVKVREAFTLAVDRQYLIDQVARGGQVPAGAFVPPGIADAAPESDFRKTGGNYYDPTSAAVEANVKKAQELLAEAGYPGGKGFPSVEFLYNSNDLHRATAETLQNMWQKNLGVTVTLSNQDWSVFIQTRRDATYSGMARDGWVADFADPVNFMDLFVTGGGNNNANFSDPAFDEAEAKVHNTVVQADRMKYLHQAEDIVIGKDWAVCPLYFYTWAYMYNPKLKGLCYSPLGYWFFTNASVAK
jgi:oligopeptide transport system substrate-binding protein